MKQPGKPSPAAPPPDSVVHRFGAPRDIVLDRAGSARAAEPIPRRAGAPKTRIRLLLAAGGFGVLFTALVGKLADATIVHPVPLKGEFAAHRPPTLAEPNSPTMGTLQPTPISASASTDVLPRAHRAMITDRNGEILAISLPLAAVYANPKEMIDQADAAHRLALAIPGVDEAELRERLLGDKSFVYVSRHITPKQQNAVNHLGIPGIYFEMSEQRHYPLGRVASQVLGGVNAEKQGFAGVERFFDKQLVESSMPLRLSLDVRVQAVVRDELEKAMTEFKAIGACGIVMDVRTGEVIAMANLPDYDANDLGHTRPDALINRAVGAMYEPGSTFKLQTAAMALDSGAAHLWDEFDAADPIKIGRFTITDFEGKHRWLALPEVLVYSSNLGAAHIAMAVGAERQRDWLKSMGMFQRIGIELPEAGMPIVPPVVNWKEAATMTIGFGHGIAVSPLHVVRGTAAIANGGIVLKPTILALASGQQPEGTRVMSQATSDVMRRLMRLVVTDGYGKAAEVAGYFVGGKTGTAEKVGHGAYRKHANVSAFMSIFPMNAPRYAVYMMLDEPHADASTHGYATAGWVSAPAAGKVIARIGPMLGLLPQLDDETAIQASLAMPLQPGRGYVPKPLPAAAPAQSERPMSERPSSENPARANAPDTMETPRAARDLRHEAMYVQPHGSAQ